MTDGELAHCQVCDLRWDAEVTRRLAIDAFIDKWTREADEYVRGAMFDSPVGDMNRASARVVRTMLRELAETVTSAAVEGERLATEPRS